MSFRAAHAGVSPDGATDGAVESWQGWHDLAGRCLDRLTGEAGPPDATLGILYVSEPLAAEFPEIAGHFAVRTGVANWVGAVAPGICGTGSDYFSGPAIAAMLCDFPAESTFLVRGLAGDAGALTAWTAARQPALGIVHGDPRSPALMSLAPELASATGAFLVGGLTSAVPGNQIAGAVAEGGLSGVLLAGDVAVATGLTQGCSPIGPVRTVTALDDNAIVELDGRPALEAFREDIGEVLARDLRRVAGYIHGAVPVAGSDTGDYLVRNLTALDPANGTVSLAALMSEGDRVMFVRRDATSAVEDMQRMLDALKRRIGTRPARGGIYHSCVARGPNQFGPGARELTAIRETFGDIPLVGFFGNGEISHDRLYSYTGVLTLFLE
jgi:small ligand-binding sensory domain FIST